MFASRRYTRKNAVTLLVYMAVTHRIFAAEMSEPQKKNPVDDELPKHAFMAFNFIDKVLAKQQQQT